MLNNSKTNDAYYRENARESRSGHRRGKICKNFERIFNYLTIKPLVSNI